jgi:broad-specificity NMP kinase
MEAAIKDFIEWMQSLPVQEIKYYAVFDPSTGAVSGIYPDHSCPDTPSKIEVDDEIAQSVLEGKTQLSSYVVDIDDNSLEIVENKSLTKIDDVLHRIIERQWSNIENPDISIVVNKANSKLRIQLSKKFYQSRKIYWDGSTEMLFLITDYNDPNGLHDTISITINELFDRETAEFEIDFPAEFSVYTRRIFKNYLMTYENN